ncbi:hypothetical protein PENPOL_c029G08927 [Penicillium polonicum]|uniref:Uncharacterized protein n=1 Tax=Penicillium polonicum TaxID=60169 RepID=A0A1V6N6G3_PENPO|nr:hypothetical protein PENPOL_c029G08927 [Penicillium polonicum]
MLNLAVTLRVVYDLRPSTRPSEVQGRL